MAHVNQQFQSAPMGRRVVLPTALAFAVAFVALAVSAFLLITKQGMPGGARVASVGAPLVVLAVVVPLFLFERSRVARFAIEDNVLVLGSKRYPLKGALSVERDPQVMSWSIKLFGNGGLGAIRGTFRSRRLGKFHAFLTDPDYAVVVRWPDLVVAVSPTDPDFFILSARAAAQPE